MAHNWRMDGETGADAGQYFGQQKKQMALENRKPVIRQASDLLGPGFANGDAVQVDDLNNILVTFNGYYSAAAGTPNAPTADEEYVGHVVSDSVLGGVQTFTGLVSNTEYRRTFRRNPNDPESLVWTRWSGQRVAPTATGYDVRPVNVPPNGTVTLPPPNLAFNDGGAECYERSGEGIRLKRPGVYTGDVQVGVTGNAGGNIGLSIPQDTGPINILHVNQLLLPTAHYPFTFFVTVPQQVLGVNIFHVDPNDDLQWWYRVSITRVSDAA